MNVQRSARLAVVAVATALLSVVSLTPSQAASGEIVKYVFQAGSNTTSIAFNPVVDSKGRYTFGDAWAKANCTNVTSTLYFNPYFNTLGSDRGNLRMIQVYMTPSRSMAMYQISTSYWPLSGSQTSGPSRGWTSFPVGTKTAFSLNFDRDIAINRSSLYLRASTTFIAADDADEPYCGVTISPRWYRY
jgi:hypothetical protein